MKGLFAAILLLVIAGCRKPVNLRAQGANAETRQTTPEEKIFLCEFPAWDWIDLEEWKTYLENSLQPDSALLENIPPGTYKGMIRFEVERDGRITNVAVKTDPGYGLGQLAVQVIRQYKSKPIAAGQFTARSYQLQPICFVIGE